MNYFILKIFQDHKKVKKRICFLMKIKNYKVTGEKCTTRTAARPTCKDRAIPKILQKKSINNRKECKNSCKENDDCEYFKWKVNVKYFLMK